MRTEDNLEDCLRSLRSFVDRGTTKGIMEEVVRLCHEFSDAEEANTQIEMALDNVFGIVYVAPKNAEKKMATICSIKYHDDQFDDRTISIAMNYEYETQVFGSLKFGNKDLVSLFVSDVCKVFEVERPNDLVGRGCICFIENGFISGIQNPITEQMLITQTWFYSRVPDTKKFPDLLPTPR